MPPRYTHYELKMEGDPDVIAFLKERLPERFDTIAEANAKRRAVRELFGDEVTCKIVSVRHIPARMRRRVLRI